VADANTDQNRDRIDDLLVQVARGRVALGVAAFAAPRLTARLVGMGRGADAGRDYAVRLFAARELVLGAGYLLSGPSGRRTWTRFGLLTDALDTAAALKTRGGVSPWATAGTAAAAGTCAAIGAAGVVKDLLG